MTAAVNGKVVTPAEWLSAQQPIGRIASFTPLSPNPDKPDTHLCCWCAPDQSQTGAGAAPTPGRVCRLCAAAGPQDPVPAYARPPTAAGAHPPSAAQPHRVSCTRAAAAAPGRGCRPVSRPVGTRRGTGAAVGCCCPGAPGGGGYEEEGPASRRGGQRAGVRVLVLERQAHWKAGSAGAHKQVNHELWEGPVGQRHCPTQRNGLMLYTAQVTSSCAMVQSCLPPAGWQGCLNR